MNLNHLKGDFDLKSFLVEYYKDFDFKITVESIILILILNQLKHDFTKHCLPAQLYVCRTVQEKYCSTIRNVLLLHFVLLALVPCFALVMSPYMAPSSYHVNRIGMGNTLFHAKQLKGTTERDTWPGSLASLTFQII